MEAQATQAAQAAPQKDDQAEWRVSAMAFLFGKTITAPKTIKGNRRTIFEIWKALIKTATRLEAVVFLREYCSQGSVTSTTDQYYKSVQTKCSRLYK